MVTPHGDSEGRQRPGLPRGNHQHLHDGGGGVEILGDDSGQTDGPRGPLEAIGNRLSALLDAYFVQERAHPFMNPLEESQDFDDHGRGGILLRSAGIVGKKN